MGKITILLVGLLFGGGVHVFAESEIERLTDSLSRTQNVGKQAQFLWQLSEAYLTKDTASS